MGPYTRTRDLPEIDISRRAAWSNPPLQQAFLHDVGSPNGRREGRAFDIAGRENEIGTLYRGREQRIQKSHVHMKDKETRTSPALLEGVFSD